MDIEVELNESRWSHMVPIIVGIAICLLLIGRSVTPADGSILTPEDWRMLRSERAYSRELRELQVAGDELVELVNSSPDPIAAGLAADRVGQLTLSGHPSLEVQRASLSDAAAAVRLWAMGGGSRGDAISELARTISLLEREDRP